MFGVGKLVVTARDKKSESYLNDPLVPGAGLVPIAIGTARFPTGV